MTLKFFKVIIVTLKAAFWSGLKFSMSFSIVDVDIRLKPELVPSALNHLVKQV